MNAIDWDLVRSSLGPLFEGLVRGTLPLTAVTFALGLVLALLVALMRLSGNWLVSAPARFYVSVIRGTPLLLQLFIVFFGLPALGLTLDPWPSAIIALSLNVGAYASEAVRGAILAVPRGQWEAAMTALGNGSIVRPSDGSPKKMMNSWSSSGVPRMSET